MHRMNNFIERCEELYKNYDFSKVNYINNNTKVIIICDIHGEFTKVPKSLLKGMGCTTCSNIRKSKSIEKLKEELIIKQGDIFDFKNAIYKNSFTKITLICKKHNLEFSSTPDRLLKGSTGCKKCRTDKLSYTNKEYIEICRKKHNNKYSYKKTEYKGSKSKVIIICKIHGEFIQTASEHLDVSGCQKCGAARKDTLMFVNECKERLENNYDYSKVHYTNNKIKIEIICKEHGSFMQKPDQHLNQKHGCPKCQNSNVSKLEVKWLDQLKIPEKNRQINLKINGKMHKFDAYNKKTKTIYEFYGDYWHGNPKRFKLSDINKRSNTTYGELYDNTLIREFKLKCLGYNIIKIWEYDFKELIKKSIP